MSKKQKQETAFAYDNPDHIIQTEYSELMKKSYIDYAMSVIISRAIPDIRDGLKPVQRRILYDMNELGVKPDKPYKKSARIVGDTMGKYHPHGDSSIYDAMVTMAQDFKKEVPLVDGHGNFGSFEGDGAAAMRYTEVRLTPIAQDAFLRDLEKEITDFEDNYDATEKEPSILPVRIPNFLVNGSEGIAVGMATSTPPHNLAECLDGTIAYLKNPNITLEKMMTYIKGPDFPSGGIVANSPDLYEIYSTGTGKIRLRGRMEVEELKNGKAQLIITEIPYTILGAGIAKLLSDIGGLVESRELSDVTDISNLSSKDGVRIILDLKKGADINHIKSVLYKKTKLEDTFGVNMLAVANGRPETLTLLSAIKYHTDFLCDITARKYESLMIKEVDQCEIQEGLIKACDVIDLIIEILRGSKTQKDAKDCLINGNTEKITFKSKKSQAQAEKLKFTEKQATAILDMRLSRLIGLEILQLQEAHKESLKKIEEYKKILGEPAELRKVIIADLKNLKKLYAIERKTEIADLPEIVLKKKELQEQELYVLVDRFGYMKTIDVSTYERNKDAVESDFKHVIHSKNTDRICLFTDTGVLHSIKVLDIPAGKLRDKGVPIDNLSSFDSMNENILLMESLAEIMQHKYLFTTTHGIMKVVPGTEFDVSKKMVAATKLAEDDKLLSIDVYDQAETIVLQSMQNMFLRFAASDVPEKKKAAVGVRGMKLKDEDIISNIWVLNSSEAVEVEVNGKPVLINRMKISKRDGTGVKK